MAKRGPKPRGDYAKKGATLGARITVQTRELLDAAATASGLSLSEEAERRLARSLSADGETEHHLLQVVRELMQRTQGFTGADWVSDPYTFDLMLAVIVVLLSSFRPEGAARVPDTLQPLRGVADAPQQIRDQFRAMIENEPADAFARSIAGGVLIDLQQHGERLGRHQRALYKRAAQYLNGLLPGPIMPRQDHKEENPI